ncbi:hypothetical protein GF339_08815 [candidate division KSB3 bacterium]|uniref:Type II secretion system protein E n=1 Tax=candidate division KSB3 bacterium TaxID=2044937 RepID=A0A9D5Q5W6_9BACT|nr:hypothetical protein [candidate division KSB3 bacterium]MBD3324672.1 hypothetical protein [candidate division KSB3 bacterium]
MEDKVLKLLRDDQVITEEQFQQVVQECEHADVSFDVALERLGILTEDQLLEFLSGKFRIPVVDWDAYAADQELLALIPEAVALKYTVFPLVLERGKRQNKITLAVADPTNVSAIDDIRFMTSGIVRPELATVRAIQQAIQTYYGGQGEAGVAAQTTSAAPASRSFGEHFTKSGIQALDALLPRLRTSNELEPEAPDPLGRLDHDHPSTQLLLNLLDTAVERGCSEIHLDPYGHEYRVRLGLHGLLHHHALVPNQAGREIALQLRRIVHPAEAATAPEHAPVKWAESVYTTHIQQKFLTLLLRFYPTPFGEKVVITLKNGTAALTIEDLGIEDPLLKTFNRMLTKPQGILLVVSPPGHGKTTTVQAIMRKYAQAQLTVTSLEHDIETCLPGVTHIPVQDHHPPREWYSLLSYINPDLLAFDTVSPSLLARLTMAFASNALVLASIPAQDFADGLCSFLTAFPVTFDLPLPKILPFLLETLNGVVAQRLIRTLCPHCKEHVPLADQDATLLRWLRGTEQDVHDDMPVYSAKGCHECMETGYRGQTGLFDILRIDKHIKQFLLQDQMISSVQLRQFWEKMPGATIKRQGFQKICEGTTSPAEIRRVLTR